MATHDYIISNASGAAVRADLNNALAAIATNNSSATEPTTTYAYQWWADTGSSPTVMKLRNAANSAWITLFQLDGEWTVVPFENGTAAAPSIYFKDSGTDTGIYSPGTDQVAITTGGTGRLFVTSSGSVGIGSSSPQNPLVVSNGGANGFEISSATNSGTTSYLLSYNRSTSAYTDLRLDASAFRFEVSATERMRLTSTGLGIGTTSPATKCVVSNNGAEGIEFEPATLSGVNQVQSYNRSGASYNSLVFNAADLRFAISGTSNEKARIDSSGRLLVGTSSSSLNTSLVLNGSSGGAGNPGILYFQRNEATPASGSSLGQIFFANNAGNAGALVTAERDGGTWTSGSSHPGKINFSTTSNGSGTPSLRWTIDSAGSLIGQSGSAFVASYIYNSTTATAANVNVDASGFLRRSTSSIKYKANVETIQDQYADAILGCRPVWYQSTCEADKPEWGHWGFIAEEVAEIDPRLCFFKEEEDGTLEPEGVQYDRFVPHLLNLIKRQKEQIEAMEARLTALESA